MGCVRPPREEDPAGAPPLSPKRRLRFRRRHKGKKSRKGESEQGDVEGPRRRGPDGTGEEREGGEGKVALKDPSDFGSRAGTLPAHLHGSTLSPLSPLSPSQRGHGTLVSPKPSPAWRGVFCLPGEEDTVSGIVDVSNLPSQTTTTTPVSTAPALGSATPGGGRVCRVKEKVQGVLEKPWLLRQKERKDGGKTAREETGDGGVRGGPEGAVAVVRTPSGREHKGVVHIREVDGKLCVVRTVYPSDFGSPVWGGQSDGEVRKERPAASPVTGNILKVQVSEEDRGGDVMSAGDLPLSSNQRPLRDPAAGGGLSLDTPACPPGRTSLLESGYASDLPQTSPETAGTTPSQTDWGGLTSSSSEMESPLWPQAAGKSLPQVCLRPTSHITHTAGTAGSPLAGGHNAERLFTAKVTFQQKSVKHSSNASL